MTAPRCPGASILIVDDEPANVMLLERILQREGYTNLHATTDSREARTLFDAFGADLVLLDLQMPHLDGFDVMAQLQDAVSAGAYLPILVLTSDVTTQTRDRALREGAQDFLTKPFDRTEVLLRLANLLETHSLHQQLREHNRVLENRLRDRAEAEQRVADQRRERRRRIQGVLDGGGLSIVYQPIAHLRTGRIVGAEALARFTGEPHRGPDGWFAEAATVGLGVELELAAIRAAITRFDRLPTDAYLSVNVSPDTLLSGSLAAVLAAAPAGRLVVELTEHAAVGDYPAINQVMAPLRQQGMRLAIDDTGAGFASLEHVLRLRPDIVKLDVALTHDIDTDPVRRALASALLTFTADIGAVIVAEGVETQAELATLRELQVRYGQGYYLARPAPLPCPQPALAHIALDTRTPSRPWQQRQVAR